MYACMYVCMDVCMDVCMYGCMYVCMYGCMDVCMYVKRTEQLTLAVWAYIKNAIDLRLTGIDEFTIDN